MVRWIRRFPMLPRTLALAAGALVAVLALFAYLGSDAADNAVTQTKELERRYASLAADNLDARLEDYWKLLNGFAAAAAVNTMDYDLQQEKELMQEVRQSGLYRRFVFLLTADGMMIHTEPPLGAARMALVQTEAEKAVLRKTQSVTGFLLDPQDGQPIVLFFTPVLDSNFERVAWVGGAEEVSALPVRSFAELLDLDESSSAYVVDQAGHKAEVTADGMARLVRLSYFDRYAPLVAGGTPQLTSLNLPSERGTEPYFVAVAPLSRAPWAVVIEQPEAIVNAQLAALRWQFVFVGFGLLSVLAVAAWMINGVMVAPIRSLAAATQRLTDGDLQTPIPMEGNDEITMLARGFETMRRRLAEWSGNLEQAVQRQTHKLSTLYAIDQVASRSLDLDTVLEFSLDSVLDLMKAGAGALYLIEAEGPMRLRWQKGLPPELAESLARIRTGEGAIGKCALEKRVTGTGRGEGRASAVLPALREAGFLREVCTPLIAKDQALGVLALFYGSEPQPLSEDRELLSSIGQQIGGAVHNAQLFASEQRRREEAERLYEAARTIGAPLSLPEVLARILAELKRVVPYDAATVYLEEAGGLRVLGGHGSPADDSQTAGLVEAEPESAAGAVLRRKEPLRVPDIARMGILSRPRGRGTAPAGAWMGIPLSFGERLIGLVGLEKDEQEFYTEEHVRLASAFAMQAAALIENARLIGELQENLDRISSFYDLGAEIISTATPFEAASAVVKRVVESIGAHSAVVTLFEESGIVGLRIGASASGSPPPEPAPRPTGTTMKVWRTGEPLVIPHEDGRLINPQLAERGVRAMVGLPLRATGRVIGTLFVRYEEPHPFSEKEVRILTTFANTAATALERARLLEETNRRLEEVKALFDLSSQLRETNTLHEMLPAILQKVLQVAHADAVSVFLVEEGGAVCREAEGFAREMVGSRIPLGEGIVGIAIAKGEVQQRPFVQGGQLLNQAGRSAVVRGVGCDLCLPLRTTDTVVGALRLISVNRSQFDAGEIRLLSTIADFAGGSIHRAMLFEQLDHRVRELGSLYEVSSGVTASLRVEDVISLIIESAPRAVQASYGCLFLWDDDESRLVMRAETGQGGASAAKARYKSGEGLAGWIFMERRAALVPDVSKDPRWKQESGFHPEGAGLKAPIREVLGVPLLHGDRVLGVIEVANRAGGGVFTEADLSLLTALAGQTAIAIENAMLFEDVRGLSVSAISALATAIDARDPYTRGHSEGVTRLVVSLARRLGWEGADLEMLEFAALLHDVGKIAVPDSILRKPGSLLPDEWNVMVLHPYHSTQIVRPVAPLRRIIPWIYHHHEHWDGKGYPDQLAGDAIPEGARILSVADAFNAMTTDRPYRQAIPREAAVAEIERCAGHQFDPAVAKIFVALLREEAG